MIKMKNIKRVTLKILAGAVAIALIGCILYVTNSFVGNPISAMRANKAIKQYVNQNYSFLDLEIEKVSYNFKDGMYMGRVKSKTSIDTKFAVYYRSGKVQRDDYEAYVLGMFNTIQRLSDEYSAIAKNIVAKELGYENNTTMVDSGKGEFERLNSIVKLDMKFDKALFINPEVIIRLEAMDKSSKSIAKVLTDARRAFEKNGYNFSKYGLDSESKNSYIMVSNVTTKDIDSGELINLLEKAKENKSGSGLSVLIKE